MTIEQKVPCMPRIHIVRNGNPGDVFSEPQFFQKVYDLMNCSHFLGKVSYNDFWKNVIFQDLSEISSERESIDAYDHMVKVFYPKISLVFGKGLTDSNFANWATYKVVRKFHRWKWYRGEFIQLMNENCTVFQLNLEQSIESKNYFQGFCCILNIIARYIY